MKLKRILKWTSIIILLALILWGFTAYWTSTNDCNRNAATPTDPMKAIRYCEYGSPDVVKLEDVEKPVPNDNQVLIKVRAASLNALDVVRDPRFVAWSLDLRVAQTKRHAAGPRCRRPGGSGRQKRDAIQTGRRSVRHLSRRSWPSMQCTLERALVMKPPNVSFEQAASLPLAGLTALQGLREGKIQPGQKVLINGATGGVGTFAVQIAKSLGAEVTAVCSTRNVDLVRSIGADHVIDYTKEDFTKSDQRYDVIFDNVCNHSFAERRRVLNPKGICVLAGMGGAGVKGRRGHRTHRQ